MKRDTYFVQLDALTKQVREEMAQMEKVALSRGKDLKDPNTRCGIFCNAIIKLKFAYAEQFRRQEDLTFEQNKLLYADANNIFLPGLIRSQRGTCVSMPLVYLTIGQRLGLPVHLVAIGKHYFIRWLEPGYRMNIETTVVDKVWVTEDDSAYLENEGLTREQLRGSDLRNLTNREVIGQIFFVRSTHWVAARISKSRSWADLSRAFHMAADDHAIAGTHQAIFARNGITSTDTLTTLRQKESNSL